VPAGAGRDRLSGVAGVVLAAGAGTRFRAAGGGMKVLAPWRGRPLLEWPLRAVEAAGLRDRVVVLGSGADVVLAQVQLHGARPVVAERWADGMAASLRCGLAALDATVEGAVVLLGDGPRLDAEAVRRVAEALADGHGLVTAGYRDGRGHPVGLARSLWSRLPERGEAGGRALGPPDVVVDCSDLEPPGDADTPQELAEPHRR
jgi:CTP:molybdopterin cytidylyltransferase MocA